MEQKKYTYYDGQAVPLHERMQRVEKLAEWMDARWEIPGTKWRIGIDGILGILPGFGDTLSAFISGYIIHEAHQLGAPTHIKMRMLGNMLLDWILGSIPLLGDIFDFAWKANQRNVHLLRKYMASQR